ncbi:MAG: ribbon-helix-helix protein, CopG family [Candidatus Binatia bacterium]
MGRTSRLLAVSLPPDLAEAYEVLAKELGKNKSELFREMFAVYQGVREEQELYRLQRRIARQVGKRFTEKEIEKIVFEDR